MTCPAGLGGHVRHAPIDAPHVAAARERVVEEGGGLVGHERAEAAALRGDGGRAVGPDLQDLDHERIAGLRALDRDRPHLTPPLAAGLFVPIAPEALALEHVAGTDGQDRGRTASVGSRRLASDASPRAGQAVATRSTVAAAAGRARGPGRRPIPRVGMSAAGRAFISRTSARTEQRFRRVPMRIAYRPTIAAAIGPTAIGKEDPEPRAVGSLAPGAQRGHHLGRPLAGLDRHAPIALAFSVRGARRRQAAHQRQAPASASRIQLADS